MKHCLHCNKVFQPKRNTKKYCSDSCRVTACQERKGVEKPNFIKQYQNYTRKTKPNPKISAIGNLIDVQGNRLQELKAKRHALIEDFQNLLNSKPEFKGKLIGLGAGLYLGQNKPDLTQILVTGSLMWFGHQYDKESAKLKEINREKQMLFIRQRIAELNNEITTIEISINQNKSVMESEPKNIDVEIQEEEIKLELPELIPIPVGSLNISNKTIRLSELKQLKFETLKLSSEYFELIGEPESNFYCIVYGLPAQGKSTWTIKFAEYLSNNFGKVLYNSSEEGFSKSLQNKANLLDSEYLHFSGFKTFKDIRNAIKSGHYRFIVIDSINDMKITSSEINELRKEFNKSAFIGIMQATKDGSFKGSNEFAHDADIKIRLENFHPVVEKTRFK